MVRLQLAAALVPLAAAWPQVMEMQRRAVEPEPREPVFLSGRSNTGTPVAGFDPEEQFVNVAPGTEHEFKAPVAGDIRGQCPGLNAASNHGYLPHNGIVSTAQTISGLGEAYGMSPDLSLFLAIVSIALAGDPIAGTWSIGGGYPAVLPLIGGQPSGIAGTHNQYESDASIVRGDAYLNNGRVGVFQMRSWEHLWSLGEEYTLDLAAKQSDYVTRWSKANNPYFFQGAFAGLVSPAAHDFVIHFMSNRSAEHPAGVLNREVLKAFFAVEGDAPGSFVHNRGQERIPEQWYRRPTANALTIPEVVSDVLVNNAMYPGIVGLGGNVGKVNSYVGLDLGDVSGGLFNLDSLAEGNNAACFFLQASMQGLPDATDPLLGAVGSVLGFALNGLSPLMEKFGCPQLTSFDNSLFDQFPGAQYKAEGQK